MGRTSAVARWFSNAAARLKILLQARSLQVDHETNLRIQIDAGARAHGCIMYPHTCDMRGLEDIFVQGPPTLHVRKRISADTTHSLWRWRPPKYRILENHQIHVLVQAVKVPSEEARLCIRGKEWVLVHVHMKAPLTFHTWLRQ